MSSFVEVNKHNNSKNLCTSVLNCIVRFVKEKNYIFEYNIAFRKYKNVRISIHLRCLKYTLRNKVNYSKEK